MTAEQARSFDRLSQTSILQIATGLDARGDQTCLPYADCFTFGRWRAQGFHVRRGEKGIAFASWVPIGGNDGDDDDGAGEPSAPRLISRTLYVFCRHQVEADAGELVGVAS